MPWHDAASASDTEHKPEDGVRSEAKVQVSDDIREWDYGDYEGMTSHQVRGFLNCGWRRTESGRTGDGVRGCSVRLAGRTD